MMSTATNLNWQYKTKDQFILTNGRVFKPVEKPDWIKWGTIKECYANAAMLVIENPERFVYCEGVALGVIPTEHAWLYDLEQNQMIDHTWQGGLGSAYIGVGFSFDYLRKVILKRKTYGPLIDNFNDRWPLLSGRHKRFLHPNLPPDPELIKRLNNVTENTPTNNT